MVKYTYRMSENEFPSLHKKDVDVTRDLNSNVKRSTFLKLLFYWFLSWTPPLETGPGLVWDSSEETTEEVVWRVFGVSSATLSEIVRGPKGAPSTKVEIRW